MSRESTGSDLVLGTFRTRALVVEGRGPAAILLHGFSDSADTWAGVLEGLETRGVPGVALDLPGFGSADPLRKGPLLPQLDAFVAEAVAHWTIDGQPPVLVGNSLGGLLAMRAAQASPETIAGVVLVSPAGLIHSRWISAAWAVSKINPLLFTPVVPMAAYRWAATNAFGYLAGGGRPLAPGSARAFGSQFKRRKDVARVFAKVPVLLAELHECQHGPITVPTSVIWGEHDRLTKVEGVVPLAELLADGSLLVVPDCGHCAQLQAPQLVVDEIASLLDRLNVGVVRRRG